MIAGASVLKYDFVPCYQFGWLRRNSKLIAADSFWLRRPDFMGQALTITR
jgi:hypothetical protein